MSRTIPDPGFPDDDGAADATLTGALSDFAAGFGTYVDVLVALQGGRLLVPVVAIAGDLEVDEAGLAHDKTSDMAAVLLARPDGRRGLLAFTSTATLSAWDPQARPVPVAAATAAQAALQERAAALVIDVAGPVAFPIEGEDLRAIAAGWQLSRLGERTAWIRPASE